MRIFVACAEKNGKIKDVDVMSRFNEWLDFQCKHLDKGYNIEQKGITLNGYWL